MDADVGEPVKRTPRVIATVTFLLMVAVAYAGADHPPPWGFLALVFLLGAWSVLLSVLMQPMAEGAPASARAWARLGLWSAFGMGANVVLLNAARAVMAPPLPAAAWIGVAVAAVGGGCVGLASAVVTRFVTRSRGAAAEVPASESAAEESDSR